MLDGIRNLPLEVGTNSSGTLGHRHSKAQPGGGLVISKAQPEDGLVISKARPGVWACNIVATVIEWLR